MEQSSRAGMGPFKRIVRRVAEAWLAWKRLRYWTQARQVEHLRTMLLADHRWLAADKTADALTERYLAALAPDWYARSHEDTARLRSRLGLVPPQGYDPGPGPLDILDCLTDRPDVSGRVVHGKCVNIALCEVSREWRKCWRSGCADAKHCAAPNA